MSKTGRSRIVEGSPEAIGRAIVRAREAAGFTPEELAEIVGKCSRLIRYWESGDREPCISDICRVAAACGQRVSRLLAELDDLPV